MQVTFMRFLSQDSAYVGLGSAIEVYRQVTGKPDADQSDLNEQVELDEIRYEERLLQPGQPMPVGHLVGY